MTNTKQEQDYFIHLANTFIGTKGDHLKFYRECLQIIEKKIDFLDDIYQTPKQFSDEFCDAAYKERQALCRQTSALH
jgi:hypothetical protein